MFDVKTCQRKIAEHYQKTAKVPTTAWSSVLQVDLEQIYTRLSWVKQKQTTAGSSQKGLNHYTEIFTEKTANGVVAKRILVQGETGIGKTTFVKKLLMDWSNLEEARMDEKQKDALRKFDLVVSINLKEVSKCQTFKEVVIRSRLFPEDDEKSVDDLLCYIHANQDKVLLVFDGYDEYRTGSEAEKRFGSRSSSPIFEIFHGNIFRECTVLVTTRISRADEIRVPADIQAEITGFNMLDREDFMRKMLDNQTDVDGLLEFLQESELNDLARVPLLSLFFCLLWKSEKEKLIELTKRKAKLYQAIVKHILQHCHRRHTSSKASKLKETDYEDILAEIGKVALAGLLKGDLVLEFGQLPEKLHDEEGVIVGLFQFSECGQSLEPMEMVSFIHWSIQEYLAAWYLIYSCVPKGSLGEIERHARTLEDCEVLKNVFQFVCGSSDEGAMKVLEHLTSVRMSDPTLDLSKMIPDVETETEVPVCNVTDRHERFSNLVYDSFQEVQSKGELLSHFLDCTGGVILISEGIKSFNGRIFFSELLPDVKVLTKLTHNSVFSFTDSRFLHDFGMLGEDSILYKLLDFVNCLQKPLRITDNSEFLRVEDFLMKFSSFCCSLKFILRFRNGQCQFYIIKLCLVCEEHARIFTESTTISVPSGAAVGFCSEKSCLKFLRSLSCMRLSSQTAKGLGAVIGNCKHLTKIKLLEGDDSICSLLEQVRSPSKCSVTIGKSILLDYQGSGAHLTSVGAVRLASLLSKFNNVIVLNLHLEDCCAAAVDTLVTNITHKTLNELLLFGISLTPAASKALGLSLPEMSSLQRLMLTSFHESILEAEEMEALFGGFKKVMPLCQLTFSGFSVRSLSPLIRCLPFFPDLRELELHGLSIDESDQYRLLKSFGFLTKLLVSISEETSPISFHYHRSMYDKEVQLNVITLTPALAAMLGRTLPELSSLKSLYVWTNRSILKAEMEALFDGFNKTMPLQTLMITALCKTGGFAPLFRSFRFFPNLINLSLRALNMDEHDFRGLLESFQFILNLQELDLSYNPLGHAITGIVTHVIHLKKLRYLCIAYTGHSEEDLNYVRDTVQQVLPEVQFSSWERNLPSCK